MLMEDPKLNASNKNKMEKKDKELRVNLKSKSKKDRDKKSSNNKLSNQIRRKFKKLTLVHISILTLFAFWCGVIFTNFAINSSLRGRCSTPECQPKVGNFTIDVYSKHGAHDTKSNKFITRTQVSDGSKNLANKKLILLYGENIWTKYDKWLRFDWRKCPPRYSSCRIITDSNRLYESDAIVYNAAKMPSLDHVENVRNVKILKRVFLSGLTPLRTRFEPNNYDNFFDLSITYRAESDVRIPYWPNDGLLPAMYRPKRPGRSVVGEELLDLEDDVKGYFKKFGKEFFMGYTIKNCGEQYYPNLFVGKLREEGLINTYALNSSYACIKQIKETVKLPCKGVETDDCVKHFEKFKFFIVADEDLCTDYTTRDYWNAILAWEAVPLLYGASNYSKFLIPNSYIDTVGNEDYISPSFKKAYGPSQNDIEYYKTFRLWKHEDRVETFYWQCELCRELSSPKYRQKIKMSEFWNKEEHCGNKLTVHELMRLQLVRTGVIR